ncbi:MAG: hypothetical protein K6F33_00510 [Bacteroidales bacterium]|nr:hypothetical protein [Bacteroidales bacterium]
MAKLTLSVNPGNDNAQKPAGDQPSANKLSITKKVATEPDHAANQGSAASLSQKIDNPNPTSPSELADDVARWLIGQFGEELFSELLKNPNLKLPYADEDITPELWLERGIKTLFTQDNIAHIYKVTANIGKSSSSDADVDAAVDERMAQKVEKYNAKFQELRSNMEDLEGEKAALQSRLNKTLEADAFVKATFRDSDGETDSQKRIARTLEEAIGQGGDDNLPKFVTKFAQGWSALQYVLRTTSDMSDDKAKLDIVYPALTNLLACVSGCYVSDRRMVLELVAKHCNEFFSDYDFISPEQTLNADPDIHNATGLGNAQIREGVSFCVVRRDTKKTVKYADVLTNK